MISWSKYITPAVHASIWLVVLGIPTLVFRNVDFRTGLPGHYFLLTNIYHIALFYFNAYFLYPKLLNRKTWWLYLLSIPAIVFLSFRLKIAFIQLADPGFEINEMNARIIFFPAIGILFLSFLFRLIVNRVQYERREKERRAEHLASELKFLRSQINPHYLFNVLTNMVSLARKKSDLLEPMLIRLSDLLRYTLYETTAGRLPLEKEITSLKDYIELQQLRFGDDVKVNLQIETDDNPYTIEPMLLIPFVENAFKHGVGLVNSPFIDILLEVRKGALTYRVTNNYNSENLSKDTHAGIGLANVKNRLQLLYEGSYNLVIHNDGKLYSIELKLQLS